MTVYDNGNYRVDTLLRDGVTWYGVFDDVSNGLVWATTNKEDAIAAAHRYQAIFNGRCAL
jgi:hypothetical protein